MLTWSPPHSQQSSDTTHLHTNLGPLLVCCRLTGLVAFDDGGGMAGRSRQWLYTSLALPILFLSLPFTSVVPVSAGFLSSLP